MAHTLTHHQAYLVKERKSGSSVFPRFFKWAANQDEKFHVGWVGASVMLMGGVIFPVAVAFILLNGADFSLIMAAMSTLVLVLVANLAALPTKYTIPLLFLGVLINIGLIIASFLMK